MSDPSIKRGPSSEVPCIGYDATTKHAYVPLEVVSVQQDATTGQWYGVLNVNATVSPAANQRVNAQSGDFVDGALATLGAKADAASTDSTTTNTTHSFIKGLVKILADIWDNTNHWLQVKVMNGNANGQATMVNSAPVVLASNQSTIPTLDTNSAASKADLDLLVTQTLTPNVSDRWARQVGQIDIARVLGAAISVSNPLIVEQAIQAAILAGQGYKATTGRQVTLTNANLVMGASLFNPSSGKNILIYSVRVSQQAAVTTNQLNLTTADPALAVTTTSYNLKPGGAASVANVTQPAAAATASIAVTGNNIDGMFLASNVHSEFLPNGQFILLPSGAANGAAVFTTVATAGNAYSVTFSWIEY